VKTDIFLNIGYVYDAVWTIALALNASISTLEEKGLGRLEEYHSEWTEMSDVLTASVTNVSFEGISVFTFYFFTLTYNPNSCIKLVCLLCYTGVGIIL